MSGLTRTKIPTAGIFGMKNAYSWNPVRGCANFTCPLHPKIKGKCWAASICRRMAGPWAKSEIKNNKFQYPHPDKAIKFVTEELKSFNPQWLGTQYVKEFPKERSCILVGYQTDLAFVPREWTNRIIEKIIEDNRVRDEHGLERHIFPFLTKAPGNLYPHHSWPENCWLGFTAMNQEEYCERALMIHDGFTTTTKEGISLCYAKFYAYLEPIRGEINPFDYQAMSPRNWVKWVIVGGGPNPLNPDWVRSIRDKCQAAGVPFYFKGWGKKIWFANRHWSKREFNKMKKNNTMGWVYYNNEIDGTTWEQFPEVK